MVSLKDIATVCGVSVATVSKALNDHRDVSEGTKQRVRQAAEELGYLPNSAAKTLKTNRTYNLGVLYVDERAKIQIHEYHSSILESFRRNIETAGYDLTYINCNSTHGSRMSYLAHARYRGFDGVCCAFIDYTDPEVAELVRSNIPMVTIDYVYDNRMSVQSDNTDGMRQLLEYVYAKGHRRIAHIHGQDCPITQTRLASFYQTAERLGLDIPDDYVKEATFLDMEATGRRTRELLDLPHPPTCILFQDDSAALGGIQAIHARGLRIPEDISVTGYDGLHLVQNIQPRLTTIWQDTWSIGARAAQQLISLIEHPKTTMVGHIMIPVTFLPGESVRELAPDDANEVSV